MKWTGLSPEMAREKLVNKEKYKMPKKMSLKEAVSKYVKDGDNIGIGGFVNSRQPVAIVHEILRQGRKDLILSFQSSGLSPEYFATGMVVEEDRNSISRLELAYFGHEIFGISPLFRYLAENKIIEFEDWSNFNMSARFKAAAMGLTFIPTSTGGSDMPANNRSKTMKCPFTGKTTMLLPASYPNVGILHVQEADIYGNCRIKGSVFTCPEIAFASHYTIVTCEKLVGHEEIVKYPHQINIPYFAVDAVCEVPMGGYPGNVYGHYFFDQKHIGELIKCGNEFRSGDPESLQNYYRKYIAGVNNTADFIAQIPPGQIEKAKINEPIKD
jgi:glutaconate CoA-transferase subunit A